MKFDSFENNPSKLGNKINELKTKFDSARTILTTLPGIDMSYTEQQEYYETLLKQYKREKELLESYKEICQFDINQLEKGPSESFLNNNDNKTPDPIEGQETINDVSDLTNLETLQLPLTEPVLIKEEITAMEMDNFQAPPAMN